MKNDNTSNNTNYLYYATLPSSANIKIAPMCTHLPGATSLKQDHVSYYSASNIMYFYMNTVGANVGNNATAVNNWVAQNPMTVLYALKTPIETPLSEEELAAYAALHTYSPNTTAHNSVGAGMKLTYYTPTTAVQMVHSPADEGKVLTIDEHGCVVIGDPMNTIAEATTSSAGLMSAADKKLAGALTPTSLGGFKDKTVADLRAAIESWLATYAAYPNATAVFSSGNEWINYWNASNLTTALTGGGQWTIRIIASYAANSYI